MTDFAFDQALRSLQEFCPGFERDDLIACLKRWNNDPNRAAECIYSGDWEKEKAGNTWDETAFAAPREGPRPLPDPPGFDVQGPDVLRPGVFDGAKSRPPSRNGDQGVENDAELARALAVSMQGVPPPTEFHPQEVGITGTNTSPTGSPFGPALPDKHYDPASWALTTTRTQEVLSDPEPKDRKRTLGTPAFLKASMPVDSLPGALAVFHSIPLARGALLAKSYAVPNYGYDDQWWNTSRRISVPRIVNLSDDTSNYALDSSEIVLETQRLMAFLDQTERAYGCADTLADVALKDWSQAELRDTTHFLQRWVRAVEQVYGKDFDDVINVFTSCATQTKDGGCLRNGFHVLEFDTAQQENPTIYTAFDNVVWADDDADVVVEFAHVICMDWFRKDSIIDVPPVIYPDRYTEPWLDIARSIRKEIRDNKAKLYELEARIERLQKFRPKGMVTISDNREYSSKMLLEAAIKHFSTPAPPSSGSDTQSSDITMHSPEIGDPVLKLRKIVTKLEEKLTELSSLQQETQQSLETLRLAYTAPDYDRREPGSKPLTKYTLRGVIIDPSNTYLIAPDSSTRRSPGSGTTSYGTGNEAWWRFQWGRSSGVGSGWEDTPRAVLEVKKVTEEEVLAAANTTGERILLIYADDAALSPIDEQPLSEQLQAFVNEDNARFHAELGFDSSLGRRKRDEDDEAENAEGGVPGNGSPKRPSNRSSVTLSAGSPRLSPQETLPNGDNGNVPGGSGLGPDGGSIVNHMIDLPPVSEMVERGHVSPVAKAFHLESIQKTAGLDEDMPDVEHVERAATERGD